MCLVRNKQLLGTIRRPGKTAGGSSNQTKEQGRPPTDGPVRNAPEAGRLRESGDDLYDDDAVEDLFVESSSLEEDSYEVVPSEDDIADSAAVPISGQMTASSRGLRVDLSEATAAVVAAATELLISEAPAPSADARRHLVPVIAGNTSAMVLPSGPPPWKDGGGETGQNGGPMRRRRDYRSRSRSLPFLCSTEHQQQQQELPQKQQQKQQRQLSTSCQHPGTSGSIIQRRNSLSEKGTEKEEKRSGKGNQKRKEARSENRWSSSKRPVPHPGVCGGGADDGVDCGDGGGDGRGSSGGKGPSRGGGGVNNSGGGGGVDPDPGGGSAAGGEGRGGEAGGHVGPTVEIFWRLKFNNRPVRAGVIRNLSNPDKPLAFYFLPT